MRAWDSFPARPPGIAEWEDLLVRYEIGPRALRVALGDAEDRAAAPEAVLDQLRALVVHEAQTEALLAAMRDRAHVREQARMEMMPADARRLYERYQRLRERNFNAVQRRGLEVWEWQAEHPAGGGRISAYQLLNAGAELDGESLALIRGALRGA